MGHRQSKRVPLKKKYKIQRRVSEHNRKQRREAKKNGGVAPGKRLTKDPGIPNMCPFKDALKFRIEQARAQTAAYLEHQKDSRRAQFMASRGIGGDSASVEALAQRASEEGEDFEARNPDRASEEGRDLPKVVDSSRKAYFREFKKVVEEADVILEVLDARDPLGYRCQEIERLIMRKDPNKKIILVLNKVDLIPRTNMIEWLKFLRHQLPTIAFKCSTQSQRSHLGQSSTPVTAAGAELLAGSECLGGETLLRLLKNYCRSANLKTSITVGIIGYPNTGKSSLINSLKRTRSVGVGATPGFTKKTQLIHLDKNIRLLDSPGIVFSAKDANSADIMLRNCVKVEQIADPIPPVELLLKRCSHEQLLVLYRIPEFADVVEFLAHIATRRGLFKAGGGQANITAAARVVIQDWNSGRIQFYTMPPELDKSGYLGAEIVSEWGKDFFDQQLLQEADDTVMESLPTLSATAQSKMIRVESTAVQADGGFTTLLNDDEERHDGASSSKDARGQIVIKTRSVDRSKSSSSSAASSSSAVTSDSDNEIDDDDEDALNARLNQNLKKQQKKLKKKEKKKQLRAQPTTLDDGDDAFDFATDFIADNDQNDDDGSDLSDSEFF